ncbi:MAG: hypothetical protein MMC33_008119 [Icmadophila ericetorum]|nr:hypothetical protein [Icmadophila ericetorum]
MSDEFEDFVDGEGYISDESSFYGDDPLKQDLEHLASAFSPSTYRSNHPPSLAGIARVHAIAAARELKEDIKLHNPYEGLKSARQLSETVPDFLKRLPPLTTQWFGTTLEPWIFIANPHSEKRATNEDWANFTALGEVVLKDLSAKRASFEESMKGKPKGTITRKLTPIRKIAEETILKEAKARKCTSGKWMLFPMPDTVNEVWGVIATETAVGRLGSAAKVAADDGQMSDRLNRLVCIYTEDFTDKRDVKRVLERLVDVGLTTRKGAEIYYKCDAYTHLGIERGNEWGIKASLYSSKEAFDWFK